MDPNEKLNLKRRVQRSIRRRKRISPLWYLLIAVVLLGVCVLLKSLPAKKTAAYDGIAGSGVATLTFTGNINCVGDGKTIDAAGYESYFEGVKELFNKTDYLSVAINDPILDDYIETYQSGMAIKFADRYFNSELGRALSDLGVDDATICNKELFRYGSKGALETLHTLEMQDISVSGVDRSVAATSAVFSSQVVGGVEVIHVGIETSDDKTRNYSSYDLRTYNDVNNNIDRDIAALRERYPEAFIAVTVSWGEYYLLKPSSYMKDICHRLIDNGADLVIGTGIQMVLSAEKYGEGYIFYGLGNLVSNEAYTMTQRGAVLNCVFDADGSVTYELVPLSVKNGMPVITDSSVILRTLVSDIGRDAEYRIENGRLLLTK
jgi:poly-gamma-glutamate synthesis protein (capsule biosynthesis protein)